MTQVGTFKYKLHFLFKMDPHLRYISVCALVISPDKSKVLLGFWDSGDTFHPREPALPGGRLEGDETLMDRLYKEIREESGDCAVLAGKINRKKKNEAWRKPFTCTV